MGLERLCGSVALWLAIMAPLILTGCADNSAKPTNAPNQSWAAKLASAINEMPADNKYAPTQEPLTRVPPLDSLPIANKNLPSLLLEYPQTTEFKIYDKRSLLISGANGLEKVTALLAEKRVPVCIGVEPPLRKAIAIFMQELPVTPSPVSRNAVMAFTTGEAPCISPQLLRDISTMLDSVAIFRKGTKVNLKVNLSIAAAYMLEATSQNHIKASLQETLQTALQE